MSLNVAGQSHTIWEAAKQEWTKHICNLLVPVIEEGFRNIYTNCEKRVRGASSSSNNHRGEQEDRENDEDDDVVVVNGPVMGAITLFKKTLQDIPKWNQEIIDQEFERILSNEDISEVLDDLVKAAFTSHILILTSVNLSGQANKKVELNIPSSKRFIHKIYIEAARVFNRKPHLFVTNYHDAESEYRFHKNGAQIDQVLCASVEEAIRKLMPIRTILRAYMAKSGEPLPDPVGALQEVEDITRRVSPRSRRGLRNILKSYIRTTSEVIDRQSEEDGEDQRAAEIKDDKNEEEEEEEELPWPTNDDGTDGDTNGETEGKEDPSSMVVEHVPRGQGRRDSLMRRRLTPERSPRPRYRSPSPRSSSKRNDSEDDDHVERRHHRRSRRDHDDDRRSRRHHRGSRRDDDDDDDDRRSQRRSRHRDDDDDRRRRRRKDDSSRSRRHRRRSDDDDNEEDDRRRRRKDGDDSADRRSRAGKSRAGENTDHQEYNADLMSLSSGSRPEKKTEIEDPVINIEKRPNKKSRSRPRSVEFRLEKDDEDDSNNHKKATKKRVTYKASDIQDDDRAFFPELEGGEASRPDAPGRGTFVDDDDFSE